MPIVAANDTRDEALGKRAVAAGSGLTAGGGDVSPDPRQISTTTISDAACDDQSSDRAIDDATMLHWVEHVRLVRVAHLACTRFGDLLVIRH